MRHTKTLGLMMFGLLVASSASAQRDPSADARDLALLRAVYAWENPVVTVPLRVANQTSYPAFALVPVAVYAAEQDWQPAARVVASEAAAGVITMALKYGLKRPRPYVTHADLPLRTDNLDRAVLKKASYSFPSGHAAFAFAAATSLSLSYPEWYVIVPAQVWAGAVSVSRLWHGAHYPSDILAGAAIGFIAAGAVDVLWPDGDESSPQGVPVQIRLRF